MLNIWQPPICSQACRAGVQGLQSKAKRRPEAAPVDVVAACSQQAAGHAAPGRRGGRAGRIDRGAPRPALAVLHVLLHHIPRQPPLLIADTSVLKPPLEALLQAGRSHLSPDLSSMCGVVAQFWLPPWPLTRCRTPHSHGPLTSEWCF